MTQPATNPLVDAETLADQLEQLSLGSNKDFALGNGRGKMREAAKVLRALSAPRVEPAAWRWEDRIYKDEWVTTYSDAKPDDLDRSRNLTALYASPSFQPDTGMRERVIEECAKVCEDLRHEDYSCETSGWSGGTFDCARAIRALIGKERT
jgi:hypothetical protein